MCHYVHYPFSLSTPQCINLVSRLSACTTFWVYDSFYAIYILIKYCIQRSNYAATLAKLDDLSAILGRVLYWLFEAGGPCL